MVIMQEKDETGLLIVLVVLTILFGSLSASELVTKEI